MGKPIKHYIADQLVGKKLHFKCSCVIPMDFIGVVESVDVSNREIVMNVNYNGKVIKIGENHPNMMVEEV